MEFEVPLNIPPSRYSIGPFWSSSKNDDVQINVYIGEIHLQLEILVANLERSPALLAQYLDKVKRTDPEYLPDAAENSSEYDFEDPVEQLYEWALKPFIDIFDKIPPLDSCQRYTLNDYLCPHKMMYTLVAEEDRLSPRRLEYHGGGRPLGALLPPELDYSTIPVFQMEQINLVLDEKLASFPSQPGKVTIENSEAAFFKTVLPGDATSTVRELTAYSKIRKADFDDAVRTSRLLGVIKDEQSSRVVGLLLSFIQSGSIPTLLCAHHHPDFTSLKDKWIDQVSHSLQALHGHGIVWGDAKPSNVLIDIEDDAYLIDFGGGYTHGWVDKEFANTTQGDVQGLQRITTYLSEEFENTNYSN